MLSSSLRATASSSSTNVGEFTKRTSLLEVLRPVPGRQVEFEVTLTQDEHPVDPLRRNEVVKRRLLNGVERGAQLAFAALDILPEALEIAEIFSGDGLIQPLDERLAVEACGIVDDFLPNGLCIDLEQVFDRRCPDVEAVVEIRR